MSAVNDFHHYKGQTLSRSEKVERQIVQMLLDSKLPDSERESSVVWELKHSSGCVQIGRILAQKRNLDVEVAEAACVLHDIYVIAEGKYANHAKKGAVLARQLLKENGEFTDNEIDLIVSAVEQHSDKQIYSDDPYVELVKDVDVFDCSLYKNSGSYYRLHKPADIVAHYEKRIKKVRAELGLPQEPIFRD